MTKEQKEQFDKASQETKAGDSLPVTTVTQSLAIFDSPKELEGFGRVGLPRMLPPTEMPVGAVLIATVKRVVENFTGAKEMEGTFCFWIQCKDNTELLFPVTGMIENAMTAFEELSDGPESSWQELILGKRIAIKRLPDSLSKKYKKTMFVFETFIEGVKA